MPLTSATLEHFYQQGRRTLLSVTLLLLLLSFAINILLSGLAGVPSTLSTWLPLLLCAALLALSCCARVPIKLVSLLGMALFLPAALLDMQEALLQGHLPLSISLWTPVMLIEAFLLLGSTWGLVVTVLLAVTLSAELVWHFPQSAPMQQAWLNLVLLSALLSALGYGLSRFVEQSLSATQSSSAALQAARRDALTGMWGRAALEEMLSAAIARAEQHRAPLSLVVCDIDHFKKVNDQYGHAKGDEVLRAVATQLRRGVVPGGLVGRWGGEEFVMVVPGMGRTDALALAEQLRRKAEQRSAGGLHITLSFGVAAYRQGEDAESLFARADQALYKAKDSGRNAVR